MSNTLNACIVHHERAMFPAVDYLIGLSTN